MRTKHKTTLFKRLGAWVLTLALVVGLLPQTAFAAETDTGKAIQLVDSGTAANIGGGQADNIYFGTYQQSSNGSGGYNIDPIKWRVLENANGQLFLLSDQNLDVFQYHTDSESVTWEKSTMRSWLNGYGAAQNTGSDNGIDYTDDNFIGAAFSEKEQKAIAETEVVNDDNPTYGTEGGDNTNDKIFLLSIAEANNDSYFADNNSRIATNTAYVAGGGKIGGGMLGVDEADTWWLRSPGNDDDIAAYVNDNGGVRSFGPNVDFVITAVRPAFNLDLTSVLFTSAAVGGKIPAASSGGNQGGEAADAIFEINDTDTNEWKLTLLDEAHNNFEISNATITGSGDTIAFSYSGAQTGTNEYISVVLETNNEITHYGRILQLDGTTNGESGTASLTLPAGVTLGDTTKLYVFNEQYNGGEKDDTKLTDYASQLIEVNLAIDYDIAITVQGGTGNSASASVNSAPATSANMGDTVTLTAAPAEDYHFVEWQVTSGGVTINEQNAFTMPAEAVAITAVFAEHTFTGWTANGNDTHTGTCSCGASTTRACTYENGICTVCRYVDLTTTDPANSTVKEGETATFTVTATGDDISYQWQISTNSGSAWTDIDGATSQSYTTQTATMDMSGYQYRCVVSNTPGDSATSSAATLTVKKTPSTIDPAYIGYFVEHYQKDPASGKYELYEQEYFMDEINAEVTATPKTYTGYTYNSGAAGTVTSGTLTKIDDEADIVTLKLYYDPESYSVTLNANGGTINSGDVTGYTYGVGATLPTDVTREGYKFAGWYEDSDFSGTKVMEITATDTGAKTYYARWLSTDAGVESVTVETDGNGTASASPASATMGQTVTLTANAASGYHFVKWEVVSGDIVLNGNTFTMPAGNVTVKAVFAEHTYGDWAQNSNDTHTRTCTACGVSQTENCSGGTATCTAQAVCAVCGRAYGEQDPDNHSKLTGIKAVSATHLTTGNIAYWHCEGCGKYYADALAAQEITLADTVLEKLPGHTADGSGWHRDENGHWQLCACGEHLDAAAHTFAWVTDKPATAAEAGSRHEQCTVCGYRKAAESIPPLAPEPDRGTDEHPEIGDAIADGTWGKTESAPADGETNTEKTVPATGDSSQPVLWIGLLAASGLGIAALLVLRRRKRQ